MAMIKLPTAVRDAQYRNTWKRQNDVLQVLPFDEVCNVGDVSIERD